MVGQNPVQKSRLILGSSDGMKTVDLIGNSRDGKLTIQRNLYRLEGDRLEVCCSGGMEAPRPAEFRAGGPGSSTFIATYERMPEPRQAGEDNQEARRQVVDLTERLARAESELQILRASETTGSPSSPRSPRHALRPP